MRRQLLGHAPDVALIAHAIANQFRDGQQFQPVRKGEANEGAARHASVIVHDCITPWSSSRGDAGQSTDASVCPARTSTPPFRARGEGTRLAARGRRAACFANGQK